MKKKKTVIDEISTKMMILKDSASIDQENEIIREMNALTDTEIISGQYIILPYYSYEFIG